MQLVSRLLVITEIDELTGAQIQCVWPVTILATRIEDDKLLIQTAPSGAKPALISGPRENLRNWIVGSVSAHATLINSVDDQVG
jgi:hypothetical protein